MTDPTHGLSVECRLVPVSGRVQGVGYRDACVDQADTIGPARRARNRADGTVGAVLRGIADRLARMRDWLRRGPPAAAVPELEVTKLEAPFRRFTRFDRRPTA